MQTLTNFIIEELGNPKKLTKGARKKIATEWARAHVSSKGGRGYKIIPGDDTFTIKYDNDKDGSRCEISMSNDMPDFLRFDINCYNLELLGESSSAFNYFDSLKARNCVCNLSGSLGEVDNGSKDIEIKYLYFKNTPKLNYGGSLSGAHFENVVIASQGDYSFLKDVKDINVRVEMDECGSISVNFDGLSINEFEAHSKTRNISTLTIKGKYEIKIVESTWWARIEGYIPSAVETYRNDHLGSILPHLKHIDTAYTGLWMDCGEHNDIVLQNILNGKLKINTVKHFQHPYSVIPMDEFLLIFKGIYAGKHGYKHTGKTEWPQYEISRETFYKWKEMTSQFDIELSHDSNEDEEIKVYIISDKSGMPIGIYYDEAPYVRQKLYTSDRELVRDVLEF